MARVSPEQLPNQLKQQLQPVYLIHGDEILLQNEACEHIRRAARNQGYSQHDVHHAEARFNWDELLMSANALSLFAEKKIIELRVPSGKLGDAGGKALRAYCSRPPEDTVLIILLPKLDKRQESSAWFKAVDSVAAVVTIWPVGLQKMPRWLEQRLASVGLHAEPDAIAVLCAKTEGNLLAAVQEIEKLKLIAEDSFIDAKTMASVVMDSARYNVFDLVDKALMADARAAVASLAGLRAEGNAAPVVLWALVNQVRTLTKVKELTEAGRPFAAAANQAKVWKNKQAMVRVACQRLKLNQLHWLLRKCAHTDSVIKGQNHGDEWNEMLDITLGLAGVEALSKRSQKMALLAVN